MAFQYQLTDAKASTLKNIAGLCVNSQEFIDIVNEAQRRLAKRGGFFDTEWLIRVCLTSSCITWPRFVGTVKGVRSCSHCSDATADMRNRWYAIIGNGSGCCGSFCGNLTVQDANPMPIINDISGTTGRYLRYYVVKRNDLGKTIRVFGTEYGGQPLQEKDGTGAWIDGITLTSTAPYTQSTKLVTRITSIVREATEGMAYLYEYDPATGLMRDLGAYEPSETNPRYRRSVVHNISSIPGTTDANGVCHRSVEAMVKLAFIPVKTDNDFLLIDDFDALKLMVQAIKAEESNDEPLAETKILKAIRELNFNDRDKSPSDQTAVRIGAVNGKMIVNPI